MSWLRSDRAAAIANGALLGAFIGAQMEVLGITGALKVGYLLAPAVVAGALIGATRARPLLWWAGAVLALTSLLAAYTPITEVLTTFQYREDTLPATGLDAVMVLSGGVTEDGMMNSETLTRLITGARLVHFRKGTPLIVSREWAPAPAFNANDGNDLTSVLALVGAPPQIYFVDSATSTRDEALRARKISLARGWQRIAVVTSPLHSGRACATFEKVGFKVTCVPSEAREFPLFSISDPGDRMKAFRNWVYEMAGTLKYRAAGWI